MRSRDAQAAYAAVDFSGTWIPDDAPRVQALFEVGLSRYPGSGMIISQDAKTLTIALSFEMGRERTLVQRNIVYQLDGAESANMSPLWPVTGVEVSRAVWDGDRLVVSLRIGNRQGRQVYSLEDGVLKVETDNTTFTFRRTGG